MNPFRTLALSLNEAEEETVKAMFAFVAVKLYDPWSTRVANVAVMFPFVDAAVTFRQYLHPTDTAPFIVFKSTVVELRLSILTPPFTFDT